METNKLPVAAQSFPAEVKLEAGITYAWCTCGLSEKQPFCDGKHKAGHDAPSPLLVLSADLTKRNAPQLGSANPSHCDGPRLSPCSERAD